MLTSRRYELTAADLRGCAILRVSLFTRKRLTKSSNHLIHLYMRLQTSLETSRDGKIHNICILYKVTVTEADAPIRNICQVMNIKLSFHITYHCNAV